MKLFPLTRHKLLSYSSHWCAYSSCYEQTCLRLQNSTHLVKLNSQYTVTTPIYYVNAAPHIGHLYTSLLADASCRWRELNGDSVKLVTGTDEHGMKIQRAADSHNVPIQSYCDDITGKYREMFTAFDINLTDFVRTTDTHHKLAVQSFWNRISHHLYQGQYKGWYCVNDEMFLSNGQVCAEEREGMTLTVSKESGQPCELMEEANYMFPLHKFSNELRQWLDSNVIHPASFRSELESILDSLGDLSVSRSSERLSWGIPVPGDPSQTIYVWLDALINYLTACGYPNTTPEWPVTCHIVGKDILKFHAIYWPAFLLAADLPLPRSIVCHSHWTVDDRKMSKSSGNVIDPMSLRHKYTSDGLRYFLLREGVLSHDGNYSESKMVDYLNSELCNTLGNLLSRCTSKSINSSQMYPPFNQSIYESMCNEDWTELITNLTQLPGAVSYHYDRYEFYKGVDCIMAQLRHTNRFMETVRPWELRKDPEILNVVLHIIMENLRVCSILLQPIIPNLSKSVLKMLGVPDHKHDYKDILPVSYHPRTRQLAPGGVLYKRIEKI